MRPHAFIAMPFGVKPGPDGVTPVDFDRVLAELLRPALEQAGFEVFRADEEPRGGDIRADMFQELLVADLVVVDLSIPNPNVWYELGVRHALRARGVVLVYGARPGADAPKAFDVYTDRKLRYAMCADGGPDPAGLASALTALARMAAETLDTSTRRIVSPVYQLLPHLEQPQWSALLMSGRNEFRDAYEAWAERVAVARRQRRAGDLLTLAEETPTRALALEARRAAGSSLLAVRQTAYALEQFELALQIAPDDLVSQQKACICLGRLGRFAEAQTRVLALQARGRTDAESLALAGRVAKDAWQARWRPEPGAETASPDALREAAAEDALLAEAIGPYLAAFEADPGHHYSGINALTLSRLREHLGGETDAALTARLEGGVRWSVAAALARTPGDYWARASQAELSLLGDEPPAVQRAWRAAVAAADGDWFALDASRQTVALLGELGWRPEACALALAVLDRELARLAPPREPRQVLLFSGHMMDRPDRPTPRFASSMEAAAQARIHAALDQWGADANDLALSQAAAGGDLLFLEACVARGLRCQVLLPLPEPEFLQASVLPSAQGESWRARWLALKPRLGLPPRVMGAELGPLPGDANPFERCNRWALHSALALGPEKLRFLCLWNGADGDGPGGTRHLMDAAQARTGQVQWIDTRQL